MPCQQHSQRMLLLFLFTTPCGFSPAVQLRKLMATYFKRKEHINESSGIVFWKSKGSKAKGIEKQEGERRVREKNSYLTKEGEAKLRSLETSNPRTAQVSIFKQLTKLFYHLMCESYKQLSICITHNYSLFLQETMTENPED